MSTADKLNKLLETKEAIKQAIIDKGGTVGDVFADYPAAIQNIQGGGGSGTFVVPAGMKFAYSKELEEFPENWDWSDYANAKDLSYMFYDCTKLKKGPKLPIANATDMDRMFYGCDALTEIDTSEWNTSNATDMQCVFYNCYKLTEIDVSKWDTSNVTDMYALFNNCQNLTAIDVSKWDTSNVTNMNSLFNGCLKLKSVKWGRFNSSLVTNFSSMFSNCQQLQSIPELDCSSNTRNIDSLYQCWNLRHFGGFKGANKSVKLDSAYSLSYESLLNIINGLADGVSGQTLTLHKDLVNQLSDDDIAIATSKGWTVSPAKTITTPIVVTNLKNVSGYQITPKTYDFSQYSGSWWTENPSNPVSLIGSRLNTIVFEADITNTTDASYMLSGCKAFAYVILHNTNNVTNMQRMFYRSNSLVEVHMTGDVSNVENVTGMFEEVSPEGTFYYNPAYDYSKIIAQLPATWTAVPLTE